MARPTREQKEAGAVAQALRTALLSDDPAVHQHGYGALFTLLQLLHAPRGAGNAIDPGFHGPLCWYAQTTPYRENLYLISRGHLKTTIITVAGIILRILRNPQVRILIVSNKAENANAMLADVKTGLTNKWLVAAFPDILYVDPEREARKWTESVIMVRRPRQTREGTVEAIGATGELTSRHYEHIVYDDLVGSENSQTREELLKSVEFIKKVQPLLDPGGTQDFVGCLPASAQVLLESGETRSIEAIKPGDRVWAPGEDGSLTTREVVAVIPQGEAQTLTITTTATTLRATPNHPFLALREHRLQWVPADELQPGEYIVAAKEIPGQLDHPWMTPEFCWLFGFLMGDGWCAVAGHRGYVGIALGKDEELNARVLALAAQWLPGKTFKRLANDNARSDSRADAEFLQSLGLVGKAKTKRLPAWAFRLPPAHRRALLKGFCEADGSERNTRGESWYVEIANRELVEDLRHLASLCGVRTGTLNTRTRSIQAPNSKAPVLAEMWGTNFNFSTVGQQEFNGIGRGKGFRAVPRIYPTPSEGLRPERVVAVVPNAHDEPVYDLTVAETPAFIANGLAVHNTTWHYADAYAWLLEQKQHHGRELGVYRQACWEDAPHTHPEAEYAPGFGWKRALFQKRFTVAAAVPGKESLLGIRAKMGSAWFAGQYLLNPSSPDTVYFDPDKLVPQRRADMPPLDTMWVCMTVDPAISTKAWADYSALAAVAFGPDGAPHIWDLRRGRWKEDELIARVYDCYDTLTAKGAQVVAVGFEAIAFAKIFRRLFEIEGERRGYYLPVVNLERDTKITKNVRIRALQPVWEAGQLHIATECEALEDFREEARNFRTDRENTHDDMLDAVVDALQLRARPFAEAPPSLYDDPEVTERLTFERELIAARQTAGRRALDATELRVAWAHRQRVSQFEAEAERGGATALAEWVG